MLVPYTHRNSVSTYNPFHDFDELERAFFSDRSLGEFKTDIRDAGDSFVLEADLPGFNKDDIHVDLSGDALTITAERHSDFEQKDKKGRYVRCERSYGSYSRQFNVEGVSTDGMKAKYEDGVLKLTLPKKTPTLPESHHLEIE